MGARIKCSSQLPTGETGKKTSWLSNATNFKAATTGPPQQIPYPPAVPQQPRFRNAVVILEDIPPLMAWYKDCWTSS